MFDWLRTKPTFVGSVLFPGSFPPRAEDFLALNRQGIRIQRCSAMRAWHWALTLQHRQWGTATLFCPHEQRRPSRQVVTHSVGLSDDEREQIMLGESSVMVGMHPDGEHVLRERKYALRFLRAVMGTDGLAAIDHVAQRFWSREALADELAHDADLDVQQIYTVHAVRAGATEDEEGPIWLHTHGLDKIGAFDFDILRPSEQVWANGDVMRAIAYAILEGTAEISTERFTLAQPGGDVRFVSADVFHERAAAADAGLRSQDDDHSEPRAVVCEPGTRLLGRWSRAVEPSHLLSHELPENLLLSLSHEASELMAQRAQATYTVFRSMLEEVSGCAFPTLVKLGYQVDGSTNENDREHLWFTVHELGDDWIGGTLLNQPYHVARLREGDRGRHPIDLLSDWAILTPAGNITPRNMLPFRFIRAHREELRRLMLESAR